MRFLFSSLLLFIELTGLSQGKITRQIVYCEGLRQSPVQWLLVVNGTIQKGVTRRNDLIKYGLKIDLEDTTFKIIGFGVGYDCHSRALFDFNERDYLGSHIDAGDPFIKGVEIGDLLVIECINIEKKGKLYLIRGLHFKVE